MIEIDHPKDLKRLRRLALAAQGLSKQASFGRGLVGVGKAIQHLGYVQLDTISVVERAHHHVLYSRIPNYKPSMLEQLLINKHIFEYWSHAAAVLPIQDYRFSLPYKHAIKSGQTHWFKNPDKKLMKKLLAQISTDGPIRARDLESKSNQSAGWWDWKPAKKALEQLYMQGDLMVSNRQGFQKTYDLTERVLPADVNDTMPSLEEFAQHLIEQQFNCHGLVSLKGFTYLRKNPALRKRVKAIIDQQLADSVLDQVKLKNGDIYYLKKASLDCSIKRSNNCLRILSPFDNSVIQRARLKSIFSFDYQIECYVPAAKRQFGYFCLPLLYQDSFIGRMDCKAHRKEQHLEIKSLHIEASAVDLDQITGVFVQALSQFIGFQKCKSVSIKKVTPKQLTAHFNNALSMTDLTNSESFK